MSEVRKVCDLRRKVILQEDSPISECPVQQGEIFGLEHEPEVEVELALGENQYCDSEDLNPCYGSE